MPLSSPDARYTENPVREIDMVALAFERFERYGFLVWPENRATYRTIAGLSSSSDRHVAGAGIGWGAHLLGAALVTDRSARHLAFCRQIYPTLATDVWDITLAPWPERHRTVVAVEVLEHVARQAEAVRHLWESATEDVWLSTPNRRHPQLGQDRPINPYHVREVTPEEFLALVPAGIAVTIHHWQTGAPLTPETTITPLLYHLTRG